jgi:hypothetical protein
MPRSTGYFKNETIDYIVKNYNKNSKILDVGAGIGTYSDLLRAKGFINIDCVEVFEQYVVDYKLAEKYNNVFIGDVTKLNLDFSGYDLIILGDVLEHIELNSAKNFLKKFVNQNLIVAVPFESEQSEHYGNSYEIHLQPDLTLENFFNRFEGFYPFCLRFDYGVFIKESVNVVYIETDEFPLPPNFRSLLEKKFNNIKFSDINPNKKTCKDNNVTIVTALWNLGRGEISDSFKRGYDNYLQKFSELLKTEVNMYIFIDPSDEEFIWKYRDKSNTRLNLMSLDELKKWFNFSDKTNELRKRESWLNQAGWLMESPQATLDSYNPVVMSKMFMLNNVTLWNPFNNEYFFWIDAGITNTVHYGYFTHNKVFDNLPDFIDNNNDFVFLTYPYIGGEEIHGFERKAIAKYSNTDYVKYVCRGGFFGGKKQRINELNGLYYSYLQNTLNDGLLGTEESIFTIMMHNHSDMITQYGIESNGLVWPFFEDLKDKKYAERVLNKKNMTLSKLNTNKVGLYVITFNSPKQFKTLIQSMLNYDEDYINKTKKYLLDNSSDLTTTEEYSNICREYGFEHIKKDNLGICGGRQWIAEHFEKETDLDYYLFFEDDMFFYSKDGVCRNGFNRYVSNLYSKSLEIIKKENFDFLKMNYSEFYGDNGTQWSWYNVPQNIREKFWPGKNRLPEMGLDPNAPKTVFTNILSHKGVPYAKGEVYYCNWPQIVSRPGNKKMFLDTTWAHPFEQTWMSHMYQLTKNEELNPGLLLMTPTEHDRFEHYERGLRKES